jgi:asparagine synthase (glutamine-hydrolysing)
MCGIAGFVGLAIPPEEAAGRVRKMCDAIVHRGPDSDGYYVVEGVALGMRRLSIIDISGGRQPISNEDGSITVVFNGEIYNHQSLRLKLEACGHRFGTRSDTEVLVHLYEEFGSEMVSRLQGMFAFAIWDARNRVLLIARDRTGMKPLSYLESSEGLLFCSELRSLWAFDPGRLKVSASAVMQYLAFGYVPDPTSIFEGVRKLPAGHLLVWSMGKGAEVRRYWAPPRTRSTSADETELVKALREKLESAVASHLEADVPLGAFLSGGLDSSTVVALMSRHASGRVRTFSIGFDEEEYDESESARTVASELGTDHTALIVRPGVEDMFETIAAMFDEPFADPSAIPNFLVAQLARSSVTVALSGDGGDELFGGYTRYGKILRRRVTGGSRLGRFVSALGLVLPHIIPGRNRLIDFGRSRWGQYAATVVQPLRLDEGGIARSDQPGGTVFVGDLLRACTSTEAGNDLAAAMMRADVETYLPGDILTKVDRTSMAVSLEARVPLLDFDLVDFAMQIPGKWRVTAHESKRLFRRAIKGIVPDSVLSRPKQGFEVPLGRWFRGPLRHRIEALRSPSPNLREYVDVGAVRRLIFEHVIGRRDHSVALWSLMVLDCWLAGFRSGRLGRPPSLPDLRVREAGTG